MGFIFQALAADLEAEELDLRLPVIPEVGENARGFRFRKTEKDKTKMGR
jgi:hypothetical protein